jgi:hypothetical protein
MIQQAKSKIGMNKVFIALGVLGGILLLKRVMRKREEERGFCESLGEKLDQGLGCIASRVGELVAPNKKS